MGQQVGRGLTRRRILKEALTLVDRDGAQALSMRRLASELDVAAMSLYNHISGRDDLLDGLSEVLVEQIGVRSADEGTPREVLRRFAHGIRAVATAHPSAFELVGMRPLRTRAALVPVEAALGALRRGGLAEDDTVNAYRALVSYTRGFALAEIVGFTLESAQGRPNGNGSRSALGEFPTIRQLGPRLGEPGRDAAFEFGLDALLAGSGV